MGTRKKGRVGERMASVRQEQAGKGNEKKQPREAG